MSPLWLGTFTFTHTKEDICETSQWDKLTLSRIWTCASWRQSQRFNPLSQTPSRPEDYRGDTFLVLILSYSLIRLFQEIHQCSSRRWWDHSSSLTEFNSEERGASLGTEVTNIWMNCTQQRLLWKVKRGVSACARVCVFVCACVCPCVCWKSGY